MSARRRSRRESGAGPTGSRWDTVRSWLSPSEQTGGGQGRLWLGPLLLGPYLLLATTNGNAAGTTGLAWLALLGMVIAAIRLARGTVRPLWLMAGEVLVGSVVTDAANSTAGGLRDLGLYLRAGSAFLAGAPVYRQAPLGLLDPPSAYPYLYPPPTLPAFGLLAMLPYPLTATLWVGFSLVAVVAALRLFGLPWRWTFAALLWPPVEQGLYVGNIVVPLVALLALAPRIGGLLPLGVLAKPQNGLLVLELVRRRRWRSLGLGLLALGVIVTVTLPLTGLDRWPQWVRGLLAYEQSQQIRPGLYGVGLGRWLPIPVFPLVGAAVALLALISDERRVLGRLGLASVVASPSLWSHGFLFAIPALLELPPLLLWAAAGLVCGRPPGPELALAIPVGWWLLARLGGAAVRDSSDRVTVTPGTARSSQRATPEQGSR